MREIIGIEVAEVKKKEKEDVTYKYQSSICTTLLCPD